jgi:lactate permease
VIDWFLASIPLLLILGLMLVLRWRGSRSGPVAWVAAVLIASLRFGAGWHVLVWAQIKGLLLALWVLYIIWAALLFFRTTDEGGAVATIGTGLSRLTTDRTLQALLLGWVFASFLQGFGGFGVPIAVVAPFLLALGFSPVTAVVVTSVGHSWGVTYGTLGSAFYALLAATGYPGELLALPMAAPMGLACFLCGAGALWAAGGPRAIPRFIVPLLLIGVTMAGTQLLMVWAGLWSIGVLCAGLAGLGVGVLWARWQGSNDPAAVLRTSSEGIPLAWAFLPYGLVVGIVLVAEFVAPVTAFLERVVVQVAVPELVTARGWTTPAGYGRVINILGHPGALLVYASLLTYGLYRWRRFYHPGAGRRVVRGAVQQGLPASIGIVTMMCMAMTMEHAGMTHLLAEGLIGVVGPAFPLLSPFIGAFGAFMTGSNANSAVIFGTLQEQAAVLVGMSVTLALAAQGVGGAIGGILAPAKVILGCSTVGADEGTTMRKSLAYGMAILAILAVVTGAVFLAQR